MNPQLVMFKLNIFFFLGLLAALGVIVVLLITAWTAVRVFVWESQKKHAEQAENRRKFGPDGQPYPPTGRGVCTGCNRAVDLAYFLRTGERLCPACYEHHASAARGMNSTARK